VKNLLPTSRLAIRVTIVVFITVIISRIVNFEHPLWSTIPAMYVASTTWGETIQKAIKRVTMTVIGCSIGGIVYYYVSYSLVWEIMFLAVGVFFITYFVNLSYNWSMFFVGFMIVFFMGLISSWDHNLLLLRILQTAIGCTTAIIVSGIIFPDFAKTKFSDDLSDFIDELEDMYQLFKTSIINKETEPIESLKKSRLLFQQKKNKIQLNHSITRYEYLLRKKPMVLSKHFFNILDLLLYYLWVLLEYGSSPSLLKNSDCFNEVINEASDSIEKHFNYLKSVISGSEDYELHGEWKPPHNKMIEIYKLSREENIPPDSVVRLTAIVSYATKIDEILIDLIRIIHIKRQIYGKYK